ncbi:MAG: hypothetical protein ACI9MC_003485 [Kiritimatiellia bacterium]|jgi:hypothetical protein
MFSIYTAQVTNKTLALDSENLDPARPNGSPPLRTRHRTFRH